MFVYVYKIYSIEEKVRTHGPMEHLKPMLSAWIMSKLQALRFPGNSSNTILNLFSV